MSTRKKESYSEELRRKYGRVSFGRFLNSWRTGENLTLAQFARKLGLSSANLCDLEQGRRIPSPTRARAIAKKLGLPEKGVVAIAIEDALAKNGMKYIVELSEAA